MDLRWAFTVLGETQRIHPISKLQRSPDAEILTKGWFATVESIWGRVVRFTLASSLPANTRLRQAFSPECEAPSGDADSPSATVKLMWVGHEQEALEEIGKQLQEARSETAANRRPV
jgi:hypothetical protein